MNSALLRAVHFVSVLVLFSCLALRGDTPTGSDSLQKTREALKKLAGHPPDPCGAESGIDEEVVKLARDVFLQSVEVVSGALNETSQASPADRATAALRKVEAMSAEENAKWPAENRFHFQVLDVAPVLVVKMDLGTNETFYVFAIQKSDLLNPSRQWNKVGSDELAYRDREPTGSWMELFALPRGPCGRARFLASVGISGCAGSFGVEYEAHEWDSDVIEEILSQEGAFGMEEFADGRHPTAKEPFAPIGKVKVAGPIVQLPYCIWSPIDFWDNPSLCALDTYDFSGDSVHFVSRAWNRPELVPIAKALEYAGKRDYPATLAYCASPTVAKKLVHGTPGVESTENPKVKRLIKGELRVEFGNATFDLVRRENGWVIAAYREK